MLTNQTGDKLIILELTGDKNKCPSLTILIMDQMKSHTCEDLIVTD